LTDTILRLAKISKRFGQTLIADDLSLEVQRGEFFTFLGPSGSGKSTILRMVAGLERPDSGRIEIDGRDVSDTPPWRRNLGMMFQQYAIFPHMSVAANVGYGLKIQHIDASIRSKRVDDMLRLVGLTDAASKDPTVLSGGEQQRVALARALAPQPKIVLLDEPLSALDERIRRAMQNELKRVHSETQTTFLYVTHDQEEALTMSDRIAVLNNGKCAQCDRPEQLYRHPRSVFVANFFRGCNVLRTEDERIDNGSARYVIAGFAIPNVPLVARATVGKHVAIRAEDVAIAAAAAASVCQLSGILEDITYRGTVLDYVLRLPDNQRIIATVTRRMEIPLNNMVSIGINPEHVIPLDD
jgi:ABC-type Fe3+/spermidine/putrescine transport system ATPase subunit